MFSALKGEAAISYCSMDRFFKDSLLTTFLKVAVAVEVFFGDLSGLGERIFGDSLFLEGLSSAAYTTV